MARIRLYVDHPLGAGQRVTLTRDQAHYLFTVMRLGPGDGVLVFNGRDGEWQAEVADAGKKGGTLACIMQTRAQEAPPDLWLICAPLRKERLAFQVEKAVELGVARIVLAQTEFTQDARRVRVDKLRATAVEAAEQCEGLYVPDVTEVRKLRDVLADLGPERQVLFCDEAMAGQNLTFRFEPGPWAILIGPEGGFSQNEREMIQARDTTCPISLGPRILRAETAAVAALTLWHLKLGDW